jgi:DNA polymerase-3 subunit alpha (Gram-positive type)
MASKNKNKVVGRLKKLLLLTLFLPFHAHSTSLSQKTFVAFDTETTGLSAKKNRIIELGVVKFKNGKIVDSAHWLIQPGCPVKNSYIHHITDAMLTNAPPFPVAYNAFRNFVGDSTLIAHNASFDVRFMQAEIERNHLDPLPNPVLDSLALFRLWYPQAPSHKLGALADWLEIPTGEKHRAEEDARILLCVLQKGIEAHPKTTLEDLRPKLHGFYYFNGSRK